MTPAEREALPPLDIPQGVHGYPFCDCDLVGGDNTCKIRPPYLSPIEYARKVIEQRERQLLAKMSLISTLELTLSNATRVGVVQGERIAVLEAVLSEYVTCGGCDWCLEQAKSVLAPPPETIPEEKK